VQITLYSANHSNDMHTTLTGDTGANRHVQISSQGDDFSGSYRSAIMASCLKNHGVIILWWDESDRNGRCERPTRTTLIITHLRVVNSLRSPKNVDGLPYMPVSVEYTGRSYIAFLSHLRTMQEIFRGGTIISW